MVLFLLLTLGTAHIPLAFYVWAWYPPLTLFISIIVVYHLLEDRGTVENPRKLMGVIVAAVLSSAVFALTISGILADVTDGWLADLPVMLLLMLVFSLAAVRNVLDIYTEELRPTELLGRISAAVVASAVLGLVVTAGLVFLTAQVHDSRVGLNYERRRMVPEDFEFMYSGDGVMVDTRTGVYGSDCLSGTVPMTFDRDERQELFSALFEHEIMYIGVDDVDPTDYSYRCDMEGPGTYTFWYAYGDSDKTFTWKGDCLHPIGSDPTDTFVLFMDGFISRKELGENIRRGCPQDTIDGPAGSVPKSVGTGVIPS